MASKKKKEHRSEGLSEFLVYIEEIIVYVYLVCMLGIFPLHYQEQYSKIGAVKYDFFKSVSLVFISASTVFLLIRLMLRKKEKKEPVPEKEKVGFWKKLSFLDKSVLVYAAVVILSYVFSSYKEFAFKGAAGWEMGLCAQMIFVALYFFLSRNAEYGYLILAVHLVVSGITYLFGILHRFEIDPLGMYEGLNLNQKIEFLSTIGQATWFSSYVCTGFAVGVVVFYLSNKKWVRMATGIYSVISFGILVTQNSDSAFIAIAGILLLWGCYSLKDIRSWCRFWEVVCLMWGTFAGMGILQRVFSQRAVPLDTLSVFFSQSFVTWLLLIISVGILLFYKSYEKKESDRLMKITRKIYKGCLGLAAVTFVGMIVFIYLNTKGHLSDWFGFKSTNHYLLFNEQWGSYRGSIWMNVWKGFLAMSPVQIIFGVGPDSLAAYLYSIPEINQSLYDLWGGVKLTNAHNEYLNSLMCYGILGLISWLTVLGGGIRYFYVKAKTEPFLMAFALCIMGYACHNIFCYQQVCCTPFLFIALGMGESLTKS